LDITTASLGHELQWNLQKQLKRWGPLVECQDVFDLLNKLETLGVGPLSELNSFHGIDSSFCIKDVALDAIVYHIITGACKNTYVTLSALLYPLYLPSNRRFESICAHQFAVVHLGRCVENCKP
jgi:hypothetical protein